MQFVISDLGNCDLLMPKKAKSPTKNDKISVKRLTKSQTEAIGVPILCLPDYPAISMAESFERLFEKGIISNELVENIRKRSRFQDLKYLI